MKYIILILLLLYTFPILAQQEGYASWYGGKFNGRLTANGEVFDMSKMTAAHKTLPFGTMVKVFNLENKNSAVVRINDRGPFVKGRIIDLSQAAAGEIGMLKTGIALVKLEILETGTGETFHNTGGTTGEHVFPGKLYTLQVGAYLKKKNAYNAREKLESAGLLVDFEKTPGGYLRVLVINVRSEKLESVKIQLHKAGFVKPLVREKN